MGLISRARDYLQTKARSLVYAWTGEKDFWQGLLPQESSAGISVTPDMAYQIGVVYACVYKISSEIAMLPLELIDESNSRFRSVDNNPAVRLLNVSPDGVLPAYYIRQAVVAMTILFGRGYLRIVRNARTGAPERLLYYSTSQVSEREIDRERIFRVISTKNGKQQQPEFVLNDDMIALRYMFSQSPVSVNRDSIGILKAAQDYLAEFYKNKGVMNGLISTDGPMAADQVSTFLKSWADQAGKSTKFLPNGAKYHRVGVEPDKAQTRDARIENAKEVCRIFNVPPAMIGIDSGGGYKDYENQAKHFATHTLAPICASIESELNLKLVVRSKQMTQKFRHDLNELTRGDMTARSNYFDKMLKAGVYSINEVRKVERYSPVDGGDVHTVQVNQLALTEFDNYSKKISAETAPPAASASAQNDDDDTDDE